MAREITLIGTMFGVDFSLHVTEASEETLKVTGIAGNQPVDLDVNLGDAFLKVSGSLLGKDFRLAGNAGG